MMKNYLKKKNKLKEGTIQILSLEDSAKFVELIISHMKNFGVKV